MREVVPRRRKKRRRASCSRVSPRVRLPKKVTKPQKDFQKLKTQRRQLRKPEMTDSNKNRVLLKTFTKVQG